MVALSVCESICHIHAPHLNPMFAIVAPVRVAVDGSNVTVIGTDGPASVAPL